MARPRAPFNPWPLLPSKTGRQSGGPAWAAFTATASLSALFLLLRLALPDLAQEVGRLVAVIGCLGGLSVALVLFVLLLGAAIATPMAPIAGPLKAIGLALIDQGLHLALVLTSSGVLGILVLHQGRLPALGFWFIALGALLWGCHRARLWLAGRSAA